MTTTSIKLKKMTFKHNPELHEIARPSTELVREMISTAHYCLDLLQRTNSGSQWGFKSKMKEINAYADRALTTIHTLFRCNYITVESYAAMTEEIRVARNEALVRRRKACR